MKKLSAREDLIYSMGGLILIGLILSGWKGALAAAALLFWMGLIAVSEKKEEVSGQEKREERQTEETVQPVSNVRYLTEEELRTKRRAS